VLHRPRQRFKPSERHTVPAFTATKIITLFY
jgi:hypothetical protein